MYRSTEADKGPDEVYLWFPSFTSVNPHNCHAGRSWNRPRLPMVKKMSGPICRLVYIVATFIEFILNALFFLLLCCMFY